MNPAEIKKQVTAGVNATTDTYGGALVARGNGDINAVMDAMVQMFSETLAAVSRVTSYSRNSRTLDEASKRLPILAGRLLLAELDRRYLDTRSEERCLLFHALCMAMTGLAVGSDTALTLSSKILIACPVVLRACAHPSGTATIDQVWTLFEVRPVFDRLTTIEKRRQHLEAVDATAKAEGYTFTQAKLRQVLLRKYGLKVSPSWFSAKWLGSEPDIPLWTDESSQGMAVLFALDSSPATWADAAEDDYELKLPKKNG